MSTRIEVSVGGDAQQRLLELNRQQSDANRLSYQQRQLQAKAEARIRAVRQARSSGTNQGVVTAPFTPPAPQKEPAAQLPQQGLELGHFWIGEEPDVTTFSTGIGAVVGDSELGRDGSNTITSLTTRQRTMLFGVGSGNQWISFDYGIVNHPPLPAETWSVYFTELYLDGPLFLYKATRDVSWSRFDASFNSWFALPAGRGVFLLVFCDSYEYSGTTATVKHVAVDSAGYAPNGGFAATTGWVELYGGDGDIGYTAVSSYSQSAVRTRIYVCTNTSAREITSFTPALQAVLDVINPPVKYDTFQQTINAQYHSYTAAFLQPMPAGTGAVFASSNRKGYYQGVSGGLEYTPYAFELINRIVPFAGNRIKSFSPKLRWGLPDSTDGGYRNFAFSANPKTTQAAYDDGLPLHHALWNKKNERPYSTGAGSYTRVGKATLTLAENRLRKTDIGRLVTVWDWDDPAYCRQMCLALGFKPEDLVP